MLRQKGVIYLIVTILIFGCVGCTGNINTLTNQEENESTGNIEQDSSDDLINDKIQGDKEDSENKGKDSSDNIYIDEEIYYDVDDSINKDIELKYPTIMGLEDIDIQNRINEELKMASLNVLNDFSSMDGMSISTTYEITLNNDRILSVLYVVNSMHEMQAYPLIRTQAVNLDMITGTELSNSDILEINDDFISYFKETFNNVSQYESDGVKENVIDYVYTNVSLEAFNEASNDSFSEISFFLSESALNISVAVPFSLGSYTVFSADYTDISEIYLLDD